MPGAPHPPLRCATRPPRAHVSARGTPGFLLPGGGAVGRTSGWRSRRRDRRLPGATIAPVAATLAPGRSAASSPSPLHPRRCAGPTTRARVPPSRRARLRAATRAPAPVARAAAADPGLLHGGAQLRGAVAEQFAAGEELVPFLGRLLREYSAPF